MGRNYSNIVRTYIPQLLRVGKNPSGIYFIQDNETMILLKSAAARAAL